MNTKARFTIVSLVIALLLAALAPTVMAGDEFNLFTGNNDFDTQNEHGFVFLHPWWTLTNGSGDKLDCSGTITPANGICAFMFKGGANEASVLMQKVKGEDLDNVNDFAAGSDITLRLAYQVNSLSDLTNLKAKALVYTNNGTYTLTAKHTGSTMIGEFTNWEAVSSTMTTLPQGTVISKIKVKFVNSSTGGKTLIDAVQVMFATVD